MLGYLGQGEDMAENLRRTEVDERGFGTLCKKSSFRILAVRGVSSMEAIIIKQEMLARGGDAAIPKLALRCDPRPEEVLIFGTSHQIAGLVKNLSGQPFRLSRLAARIDEATTMIESPERLQVSVLQVLGIKTDLISPGDDLVESLEKAMAGSGLALQDGDILVVSESTVATAEGRVVALHDVTPGPLALSMAAKYSKDPREMELILQESDEIMGGIPGVVLTLREGFLYPNAGIDNSNAPPGHVVLFPADAQKSAFEIRERMAKGSRIAVIIGDSRTHPLRLGCVGVALACVGLEPVEDARGQKDLFGRELKITRKAVADNLVSAAQIVMGEGDEGIPAVIIRDAPVPISEKSTVPCPPSHPRSACTSAHCAVAPVLTPEGMIISSSRLKKH